MNEIKIFNNDQFGNFRTSVNESGEPLFVAKDICDILEISKHRDALTKLDEDERGSVRVDTPGGVQEVAAVTESGLYTLIMRSDKKKAKPFQKWVTSEVLPSIRKSGGYIMTKEEDSAEIIMARALFVAREAMDRQKAKIAALEKEKEVAQTVLEHQAPIVQYANEVLSSNSYHTVTTIGAQFGISGTTLNRLLVRAKFIRNTEGEYSLCANHFGKDYTVTKTFKYENKETGESGTNMELRYTEKGRMKIHSIIERAKTIGLLKPVKGRLMIDKTWKKTETNA